MLYMPSLVPYIILTGFALCYGSNHEEHICIHDKIAERNPHIVNLATASQRINRRQVSLDYSNVRIHPVFTSIDPTVEMDVRSTVSASIETLQNLLMVHPVQGNLLIPPMCNAVFTSGPNVGKCQYLPPQSEYVCGELAVISPEYIGVREVCTSFDGPCSLQGPNGTGIPNADFLLFVSAFSTFDCAGGTLAYASACMLDVNDNNRPIAGYINVCPSSLTHFRGQSTLIYSLVLHEIIHAIGFSSYLFNCYMDACCIRFIDDNGNNYNPSKATDEPYRGAYIFTGPKTTELAKSYYSCERLEGLLLENEGGSGTASSHWEKRTLNNEIMNGYSSSDYEVLSEFTLAFLEDSGWYKANYTALSELNQNSLQWGRGLGCSFTTQRCTNTNVFPYLCAVDTDEVKCTYDHLSKGTCSREYSGFDGCPVLLAVDVTHYCRTELDLMETEVEEIESYGVDSICIDGVKSLSYSCGTYITKPVVPLCVQQTTYTQNNDNQYTIHIQNRSHVCRDGNAVITESNWVVLCPPTDDVSSQAAVPVPGEPPELLPSEEIATSNLEELRNFVLATGQDVVAFGGVRLPQVIVHLYISSAHSDTVPVCHLSGCATCNDSIMIEKDGTTMVTSDNIFSVRDPLITVGVVFEHIWSQLTHYSLLLMLNPLANYPFVYYVASIEFVDDYLLSLHLNDNHVIHIIALTSDTVVRIAPSDDIKIDEMTVRHGEEYILTMNIGDTLTISSSQDLTGSRVTSNKSISLFSGHYCKEGHNDNCSVLVQQIPPFNSWASAFILHTNISYDRGIIGNWVKLIASDTGANVTLNCTTDRINYESSGYSLDFREHMILFIAHKHCAVTSDENILILQFQNSNTTDTLTDTFMLIVAGLVHYETHYVFSTFDDITFATVTIPTENPRFNPLLINNTVYYTAWERIELNTVVYYYAIISLPAGIHTLGFVGNYIKLGVTIYGYNTNDTYAFPAAMRLNLTTDLPSQVPSPVQDATLTLLDGVVEVTWKPPATPNGAIHQYIVQRINASGRFFKHILANQLATSLIYYNDALVSVAVVNLHGQSQFEYAEPKEACLPSPCINGGVCAVIMDGGSQETFQCVCTPQYTGVYCETASSRTNAPPTDPEEPSTSDSNELVIIIIVTSCATTVILMILGSVLFLYIRQKLHHRAKIVDISQVTKSAGVPEARPSNQFIVKGNNNAALFYINYPQVPSSNDGQSDTNESVHTHNI